MKFSKLFVFCCMLAAITLLVPAANATTPAIVFAGAGSTAVFNALYDAALSSGSCGTNLWSHGSGAYPPPFTHGGTLHDARSGMNGVTIPDDNSNIWISFDGTAGNNYTDTTVICFYISVDSGIGVRGFLASPRALLIASDAAGTAGGSKVSGYADTVGTLPQAIWNDINVPGTACVGTTLTTCTTVTGTTMNVAFSDIRPEDAEYATCRALSARPGTNYFASSTLGYGNWNTCSDLGATPVYSGTSIASSFSTTVATPTYFEQVPGVTDLVSKATTGTYATWPVGAIPILILVSNTDTTLNTGFGNGVPGNYQLKNINRFTASFAFDGVFTRTRDIIGVAGAASVPFAEIQREPLSGTYNTFEFTVPRTHDVQGSQEDGVYPANAGYNPLNFQAATGGLRFRAIGTGEMVNAINGLATKAGLHATLPDRIGYAFWSYGNVKALAGTGCASTLNGGLPVSVSVTCTANPGGHYLLLDGVDPLFANPVDNPQGPLNPPTCTTAPNCPAIPFTHIDDGSYGAWSIVRMLVDPTVTTIPSGTGLGQIYNTLITTSATKYYDFEEVSNLKVFRSHRSFLYEGVAANSFQPVNGTLCSLPASPVWGANLTGQDMGNDVGGSILTITGDQDYAFDNQGGPVVSSANCGEAGGSNYGLVGQVQ